MDPCAAQTTCNYYTVEVIGDSTVVIHDSEIATVTITNANYDVNLISREEIPVGAGQFQCADHHPVVGTIVGIQLKNLTEVAAQP